MFSVLKDKYTFLKSSYSKNQRCLEEHRENLNSTHLIKYLSYQHCPSVMVILTLYTGGLQVMKELRSQDHLPQFCAIISIQCMHTCTISLYY